MVNDDSSDRRKAARFGTALSITIRFQSDGTPIPGSCIEVGPNGMRIMTSLPLVEAAYVLISFENASNNTHCEGRVVWTQRNMDDDNFESGVDIQKWGGSLPGASAVNELSKLQPKQDRRKKPR